MEFSVKELNENDFLKYRESYMATLSSLREVGNITDSDALNIFKKINLQDGHIFVVIDEESGIVGTATVLIEQKFIHSGGKIAHIEDVSIRADFQGSGIGKSIMNYAIEYAKSRNCYKVILDCSDRLVLYYEKFGFKKKENQMRLDF